MSANDKNYLLNLLTESHAALREVVTAVAAMPENHFPGDMLYPWGEEQGTITDLAKYMTDHAFEHRDEILKAIE